jgi:hypothetical protein
MFRELFARRSTAAAPADSGPDDEAPYEGVPSRLAGPLTAWAREFITTGNLGQRIAGHHRILGYLHPTLGEHLTSVQAPLGLWPRSIVQASLPTPLTFEHRPSATS